VDHRASLGYGGSSGPTHEDGDVVRWSGISEPWRETEDTSGGHLPEAETGGERLGQLVWASLK
jgi:hypothetical protein